MNSVVSTVVIVPGIVALLLFLVFTYLYEQSRQAYFRAWQLGWAAYTLHFALDAWNAYHAPSVWVYLAGSLLVVAMGLCLFISTRLMRERFQLRWYDVAIGAGGVGLALWNLRSHMVNGAFRSTRRPSWRRTRAWNWASRCCCSIVLSRSITTHTSETPSPSACLPCRWACGQL